MKNLLSIEVDGIECMNKIISKALTTAGKAPNEAKNHGFMQQLTLEEIDIHTWEIF